MPRLGIIDKPAKVVTVEELKKIFPKKKESITEELVDIINDANNNPFFSGDEFISTVITYKDVLEKNKASIKDYLTAIRFCAYLESEDFNLTEAFIKSHSHTEFVQKNMNSPTTSSEYKQLTNAASRYRKRPIVVQILTQSQLGLHLMFQGELYRAINVLSDIMVNGRSEMARVAAAKEILANVKAPETTKIELDIGLRNENAMESLNAQLAQFAMESYNQLKSGQTDLKQLGAMKAEEEVIDVDTE